MISVQEAVEMLKINDTAVHNVPKYKNFYIPATKGKYNARFDIDGFMAQQDKESELIARVEQFVEYLFHVEFITYSKIGKITNNSAQYIALSNYTYKRAVNIGVSLLNHDANLVERFDKYYGWKHKRKGLK